MIVSIPATIQEGKRYNRDNQFIGEGFKIGEEVRVRWTTEDIEPKTGYRLNNLSEETFITVTNDGQLTIMIPEARRLTSILFESLQ